MLPFFFFVAPVPEHSVAAFAGAFRDACVDARLSLKQVAAMLEMSEQQLDQWLTGKGNPNLYRFFALKNHAEGRAFLRAFWPHMAQAFGMEDIAATATFRDALVSFVNKVQANGLLKMAKASLPEAQRGRQSA